MPQPNQHFTNSTQTQNASLLTPPQSPLAQHPFLHNLSTTYFSQLAQAYYLTKPFNPLHITTWSPSPNVILVIYYQG